MYMSSKVVTIRARSFSNVMGAARCLAGRKREASALREVVGDEFVAFKPIPTTAMYSFPEKCELTRMPQILVYCFLSGSSGSRASGESLVSFSPAGTVAHGGLSTYKRRWATSA